MRERERETERERERERDRQIDRQRNKNFQTKGKMSKTVSDIHQRQTKTSNFAEENKKNFVFSDHFHQIIYIIPAPSTPTPRPLYPRSPPPLPPPPTPLSPPTAPFTPVSPPSCPPALYKLLKLKEKVQVKK